MWCWDDVKYSWNVYCFDRLYCITQENNLKLQYVPQTEIDNRKGFLSNTSKRVCKFANRVSRQKKNENHEEAWNFGFITLKLISKSNFSLQQVGQQFRI